MNKYKEALTNLKTYIVDYDDEFGADIYLYESYKEEFDLLQELVDKATPKKPKRGRLFYNCHNGECDKAFIYYCPVCNISSVEDMNFCFNCGQKLDWSKKDE